jgi:hypothetical protein
MVEINKNNTADDDCDNCNTLYFNSGKTIYQAKTGAGIYFLTDNFCKQCREKRGV